MVTRSPFRAKLRKPKDELWLGCIIKSKRAWINKNGDPGLTLGFKNCPWFASYTRRDFERGCPLPKIGDSINVEFRWRYLTNNVVEIAPYGRIIL